MAFERVNYNIISAEIPLASKLLAQFCHYIVRKIISLKADDYNNDGNSAFVVSIAPSEWKWVAGKLL
jgi:hypothetical protein